MHSVCFWSGVVILQTLVAVIVTVIVNMRRIQGHAAVDTWSVRACRSIQGQGRVGEIGSRGRGGEIGSLQGASWCLQRHAGEHIHS